MRTALFVLGTAFIVLGCLGIIGSWVVHDKHSRAYTDGTRVNAKVLLKHFMGAADGSSEYLVEYRFALPSRQLVEGTATLPEERWKPLRQGDSIVLAYLPEEPKRAVLPELGPPTLLLPVFLTAVCLALSLLGLGLLLASLRKPAEIAA